MSIGMRGEIISVGTELLLGQIINTNAQYISKKLGNLGIDVYFITCVGDNQNRLRDIIEIAAKRSDIIIFTGGLGPTMDDLTKETVGEHLGLSLIINPDSLNKIEAFFKKLGKKMQPNNRKQALFPKDAIILDNEVGTAPGCIIEKNEKVYILLPGPPKEMQPMFDNYIIPYLQKDNNEIILSKTLRLMGVGESTAEHLIKDILIKQTNPTIAPLAKEGEVCFRITAKSNDKEKCYALIKDTEKKLNQRFGKYIFGTEKDSIELVVVELLLSKGLTVTAAESSSCGIIASMLSNCKSKPNVFDMGYVLHSADALVNILGLDKTEIEFNGCTSKWAAKEMALKALKNTNANLAVSTTQCIFDEANKVGIVYIGISDGTHTTAKELRIVGSVDRIKHLSAKYALNELRLFLDADN
jgi:nicotinamide-nucleotide amidase